jgi:hypothetical protein
MTEQAKSDVEKSIDAIEQFKAQVKELETPSRASLR